jgi:hypothetical protein
MQNADMCKNSVIDAAVGVLAQFRRLGLNDDDLLQVVSRSSKVDDNKPMTPYERIAERRKQTLKVFQDNPNQEFPVINVAIRLKANGRSSAKIMRDTYNDIRYLIEGGELEEVKVSPKRVFYRLKRA